MARRYKPITEWEKKMYRYAKEDPAGMFAVFLEATGKYRNASLTTCFLATEKTNKEVSDEFGISPERSRQIISIQMRRSRLFFMRKIDRGVIILSREL